MKQASLFESAVSSVLRQNEGDTPDRMLVLDLDACAAGMCIIDADGPRTEEIVALDPSEDIPIGIFQEDAGRLPGGMDALMKDQSVVENVWRRYIRFDKEEDFPVLPGLNCSSLDQAYARCSRIYDQLLDRAEDMLGDGEGIRVLLIGKMACIAPAVYQVRFRFSVDPLLEDPLFLRCDQPGEIKTPQIHNISLCLLDECGNSIPIALAGVNNRDMNRSIEFLCCRDDRLDLLLDGRHCRVPLPHMVFPCGIDACMVSAAVDIDVNPPVLCIRSVHNPDFPAKVSLDMQN